MDIQNYTSGKFGHIVWDESYKIGHKKIDYQHKNLIEIINDFYQTATTTKHKTMVNSLISRIYEYTRQHFEFEESILVNSDSIDLEKFKTYHNNMEYTTLEIKKKVYSDNYKPDEVFAYLKEWWLHHILKADKKHFQFIHEEN